MTVSEQLRWLWPAAHIAMALWDDESYELLSARHIAIGRESGLLAVLPTALTTRIVACAFAGEFTAADQLVREMRVLTDAIDISMPSYGPLFLSGWRGDDAAARRDEPCGGRRRTPGAARAPAWPSPTTPAPCSTTASVATTRRWRLQRRSTPSKRRGSSSTPPAWSS